MLGVNIRQGLGDLVGKCFPLHIDQVSLCCKAHTFPTVICSSISAGDLAILSERAPYSPSHPGSCEGNETDNDLLEGRDKQKKY